MVAERKYTDRDVRENPSLRRIAVDYLMDYGGDFEPLVDAIDMLKSGAQLPTNVIRVVLNCMRHDRNVADSMPEPTRPKLELVMDEEKPKKKKKKLPWQSQCDNPESHEDHIWDEPKGDRHWCKGVPFPINREPFWARAVSRRPFVLARGGKMIHYASLEQGSGVYWSPPRHEYGMAKPHELAIKTLCRYPSILKRPILLSADDASLIVFTGPLIEKQITLCPYCVNEIEMEVEAHGANGD